MFGIALGLCFASSALAADNSDEAAVWVKYDANDGAATLVYDLYACVDTCKIQSTGNKIILGAGQWNAVEAPEAETEVYIIPTQITFPDGMTAQVVSRIWYGRSPDAINFNAISISESDAGAKIDASYIWTYNKIQK
jgi:hypothetical protein